MIETRNKGRNQFHMFKSRHVAAVLMAFLALCGVALIVGAGMLPNAGPVSFLAVGFTILGLVTIIRAWQLGSPRGSTFVSTSKVWKRRLFLATVLGAGAYTTYAMFTMGTPQAMSIGGLFLLLTSNLILMLLFEVDGDPNHMETQR